MPAAVTRTQQPTTRRHLSRPGRSSLLDVEGRRLADVRLAARPVPAAHAADSALLPAPSRRETAPISLRQRRVTHQEDIVYTRRDVPLRTRNNALDLRLNAAARGLLDAADRVVGPAASKADHFRWISQVLGRLPEDGLPIAALRVACYECLFSGGVDAAEDRGANQPH